MRVKGYHDVTPHVLVSEVVLGGEQANKRASNGKGTKALMDPFFDK
jgi:hypothetical protein